MKDLYGKGESHHNQARGGFVYRRKPYGSCAGRARHSVRAKGEPESGVQSTARPTKCAASRPSKTHTSNSTNTFVLHTNEEKWFTFCSAPCPGLCVGGDGTDGTILPGSPREPVGGASARLVCSWRALDRAARPKRRRRNHWDWGHCHSGFARVRCAVSGWVTPARGGH
jgi:hypothetical protein